MKGKHWPSAKRRDLKKDVQKAFVKYAETLPPSDVLDPDAMTARMVTEGSVAVALGLMAKALEEEDIPLRDAWRDGLIAARNRLIDYNLELNA